VSIGPAKFSLKCQDQTIDVMLDVSTLVLLAALFLCVSYLSASVGLGGGSTYTALMAVFGMSAVAIPLISLSLNLVVTTVGSYQYIRHRHASWRLIIPFLISSLPMAYWGGSIELPKGYFYGLLFVSLLIVVARIFFFERVALTWRWQMNGVGRMVVCLLLGALLGFVAGVVGIGGGIYLVPLIIVLGLGTEKQAAASGSIFIWLNSFTGVIARLQHHSIEIIDYLPLIVVVFIGGTVGSFMGAARLQPRTMQRILGGIIVLALCLLSRKLF